MSRISIQGDSSGTGTLTIQAPNTNSNYTLTLPTNTGTVMTSASDTFAGGLTLGGDLTLDSNGIYLGGTVAANYLDDYEEGTWTPTYGASSSSPTISYSSETYGRYTKIGNVVHIQGCIRTTSVSGGSGNLYIEGLPFTAGSGTGEQLAEIHVGYVGAFTTYVPDSLSVAENGTFCYCRYKGSLNGNSANMTPSNLTNSASSNYIFFTGTYISA